MDKDGKSPKRVTRGSRSNIKHDFATSCVDKKSSGHGCLDVLFKAEKATKADLSGVGHRPWTISHFLLSLLCLPSPPPNRNKQGQTRLSSYYEWISLVERSALESEIIRKCLSRSEFQCSFVEYRGYKVVYRRYASLFFIVGTKLSKDGNDNPENELGLLEFIHNLVETMDKW